MFYLKYDMYRNSWPLLALATYRNLLPRVLPAGRGNRGPYFLILILLLILILID